MTMKKFNKVNYIPVLNGSVLNCVLRDDHFIDGKLPTFYVKNGIYNYNRYLINPYHHMDLFTTIKNKNLLMDDSLIFADSGGLQEINLGEVKFSAVEIYKWQQENVDVGFSYDVIPFKNATGKFTGWVFDEANFEKCAKQSKDNINECKPYKDKNKDFLFYGIIQGRKYEEYKTWYDIIKDDFIDGYCVKTPNNNPINLAETIIFALDTFKHKPVHFLGVGNQSKSILIYYASQFFKQPVSFDSSSYDIGTQYRSYLLPFMINKKVRLMKDDYDESEKEDVCNFDDIVVPEDLNEWCNCPACAAVGKNIKDYVKNNSPMLGTLISLHNLIMNVRWNNYIETVVTNKPKLIEFIKFNFQKSVSEKILLGIDMIDSYMTHGSEYVLDHYKENLVYNKTIGNQKGLFDF